MIDYSRTAAESAPEPYEILLHFDRLTRRTQGSFDQALADLTALAAAYRARPSRAAHELRPRPQTSTPYGRAADVRAPLAAVPREGLDDSSGTAVRRAIDRVGEARERVFNALRRI